MPRILPPAGELSERSRTVRELFRMLLAHRRWWTIPFFAVVVFLSVALLLAEAVPYVAPFIYTLL
jgi:uncharacterized protein involved in exopolysaccharide biosynthesis